MTDRTKLQALFKLAMEHVTTMTEDEKDAMIRAQRRSWVIGEMMLEHPEMSREEADKLYTEMCLTNGYAP